MVVRGEAGGMPRGDFMGTSYSGKSFKVMSIDVHTVEGGRMARSYHVEDWMGGARQLAAKLKRRCARACGRFARWRL